MFGKKVMGEVDYAKQKAAAPQGLGAAIHFGKKVMGTGANAVAKAAPPAPKPPPSPAPVVAKREITDISFSETEVSEILTADPNRWKEIVAAEAKRTDGPRHAVLRDLLVIADLADPPIPSDYRDEMQRLLGEAPAAVETADAPVETPVAETPVNDPAPEPEAVEPKRSRRSR